MKDKKRKVKTDIVDINAINFFVLLGGSKPLSYKHP